MCFWAAFLLSVILRWLPATQSVVPGHLLLLLYKPKLAYLEQGLVLGCVCACTICACKCACQLRNCLLSAWLVVGVSEITPTPLLVPARPSEWLFPLTGPLGHSSPADMGLWPLASFPGGGEHWIMGNVLIILPLHTSVNIGDQKLLLVTRWIFNIPRTTFQNYLSIAS